MKIKFLIYNFIINSILILGNIVEFILFKNININII